jgi:hypothetical protein
MILLSVIMLSVTIKPLMLNIIMLSVTIKSFMLNVVILNIVMMSVIMLNVIILSVDMLNVVAPNKCLKNNFLVRDEGPYSKHFIFTITYEWAQ